MAYPNFNEEKRLWNRDFKCVVGLDEAGRGPLAGPVVAAAVVLKFKNLDLIKNLKFKIKSFSEIKDSKQLPEKKRQELYEKIINSADIEWGIGVVSEKIIDKINILEATKLAMLKALRQAQGKLKNKIDFLILDGNFKIDSDVPQKSIIKGDQKVFSISAASIIAKVTRDRIMYKYDKKYPSYGFKKHKGYPTKAHFANLEKFGPCEIHRESFWPVSKF